MNEVLIDESYGRDHVQELIQEAEQERFAQKVAQAQDSKHALAQARFLLLKVMSIFTS
jgi:hypothetical protein